MSASTFHPGQTVRFKGHCDDVASRFKIGDVLDILRFDSDGGKRTGGLICVRQSDRVRDLVWPEEVELHSELGQPQARITRPSAPFWCPPGFTLVWTFQRRPRTADPWRRKRPAAPSNFDCHPF